MLIWGDWFNVAALWLPVGNIQSTEAEAYYYAALDGQKQAAYLS